MAKSESSLGSFHSVIKTRDARENLAIDIFDRLWKRYRSRVEHVAAYERLVADAGAVFFNDHIAFRTFACQRPQTGIVSISRVFEALGYVPAGCYHFPDKHLAAIHFQHANPQFPKLFISELRVWELSDDAQETICRSLTEHRPPAPVSMLRELHQCDELQDAQRAELAQRVSEEIHELPWPIPQQADVERLNKESQYAAWVLVHGYNVNHFTSLINSHGVAALNDIEKTIDALKLAGVPMKAEIEGDRGSKLRQSATAAAVIDVPVRVGKEETTMPWTYAYFELAERGEVTDPETGKQVRFEGFLGPQATNLFEMTKVQ